MVYAYDQWAQLPVRDLYDSQMMAMAINAAKDMYEKGYQEMKDFKKEYGDFITPIAADQDWYNQNVTGKVRDAINALYAQGIDPLRNAQGRAMISQIINNIDYGGIAKMRQSQENVREYLKNKAKLQAEGLWSPEMEQYAMGGKSLESWDTSRDGMWNRTSPIQYKSMDDIIEPIVSKLDPIFDAELTAAKNDGFDYSTVTEDRIRQTIDDNMVDLIGAGTAGGYYYNKAYELTGDKEKAKELLKNWYVDRAKDHVRNKREANPYKLDEVRTKNDDWLDRQKSARDNYYSMIEGGADTNGDGKLSTEERKNWAKIVSYSKTKGNQQYDNIFREADSNSDNAQPTTYVRSEGYYQKIQPKSSKISETVAKGGNAYYTIPASEIGNVLYTHDSVYDYSSNRLTRYSAFNRSDGEYYFKPTGSIKAKEVRDSNGNVHIRYFISGTLQHSGSEEDITDASGSPKVYEMEVSERQHNYGKKQQKQ